jgi:hypothetical protein
MSSGSVFRIAAAVVAAVGLGKFMWIFVDFGFDITVSPWGFLLVFVLPFVVVLLLARRHLRAAAWVMVPFGLATFAFMVVGIIGQGGYTVEVVLVGYPAAVACAIGVVAAIRSLAVRKPVAAH